MEDYRTKQYAPPSLRRHPKAGPDSEGSRCHAPAIMPTWFYVLSNGTINIRGAAELTTIWAKPKRYKNDLPPQNMATWVIPLFLLALCMLLLGKGALTASFPGKFINLNG